MKTAFVLPEYAQRFLTTNDARHAEKVIGVFQRWLAREGLALDALTTSDVNAFMEKPNGKEVTALTRNDYRYKLRRYIDWLHAERLISFDAAWLRVRREMLADVAENFLGSLEPTLRPATCNQYRHALKTLHSSLADQGVELRQLERPHIERWLRSLYERGQGASTRVNIIVAARVYLRWSYERQLTNAPGDELIRSSDLPRLPQYLPRPLPPTADDELQRRLRDSEDPLQRGLLLMRRTGLRLGELAGLAHDCVRRDENGNVFLKVPLGKLHNERLVPMDPSTATIAEKLRAEGRSERSLLLETVRGKRTRHWHYMRALSEASQGLELTEKLTSHRLRHTYATSLMNGGMSLMGVMKLLGHRDYRMTLRYTEITLESVGDEYYAALTKLEQRYRIAIKSAPEAGIDPDEMLDDVIRWIKKRGAEHPDANSRIQALIKRLGRIREEIQQLE